MKKKTMLIIGILGIILILGAAVALAQNASNENRLVKEDHECTPEMMEDMSKNCPEQMMQSAECENMMGDEIGQNGRWMAALLQTMQKQEMESIAQIWVLTWLR